jgi:hypothetical protein
MGLFSSNEPVAITSNYAGTCKTCGAHFPSGTRVYWDKSERTTRHIDCDEARRAREKEAFSKLMDRLENSKGSAGRRNIIDKAALDIQNPEMRTKLLIEASRLDAEAALDKAESLKTDVAKRRRLQDALDAIRADPVPDHLQADQIAWLEEALIALGVDPQTLRTNAQPSTEAPIATATPPVQVAAAEPPVAPSAPPSRPTHTLTLVLAYSFGSCFGFGLMMAIGLTGTPAIILGLGGIVGCVVALKKAPRARVPAVLGIPGCALMTLMGIGSAAQKPPSTSSDIEKAAQANIAAARTRRDAARAELDKLSTTSSNSEVATICNAAAQLSAIPEEYHSRCGLALFSQGKADVAAGKSAEGLQLLTLAADMPSAKQKEAAALAVKLEQEALTQSVNKLMSSSQSKLKENNLAGAETDAAAATDAVNALLKRRPEDKVAAALALKTKAQVERVTQARERHADEERRAHFIKESCAQVATRFGPSSSLSDLQKEELWHSYADKSFSWDLEVVEVSSGLLGGYTVQFKCGRGSKSLIQDLQMSYPSSAKSLVMQLRKGSLYKIEGKLKTSSTLLGLTADPI